jgi:hypothetical protein
VRGGGRVGKSSRRSMPSLRSESFVRMLGMASFNVLMNQVRHVTSEASVTGASSAGLSRS